MPESALLLDSITKADTSAHGRVVVTGSHGGVYAAALALKAGCRAAFFNDAGVGLERAGIGGLEWLEAAGMAAAAIDHRSASIGQAAMMLAQGRVSHVNALAARCGVTPGMRCADAAAHMATAPAPTGFAPMVEEARAVLHPAGAQRCLVLVDSAALLRAEDAGQVVATGSHGALFGSDPANALKVDAFLALFNDAGGGAGTSRLPALQLREVAAVTVAAKSARIGDAHSTWSQGIISACNPRATALGARVGMPARDLVDIALR